MEESRKIAGLGIWILHDPSEAGAIDEIVGLSDRAAGIVATALLEDKLTRLLRHRLIDDESHKATVNDLFRDTGPLGSFGAKINLAFAMGVITQQAKDDLRQITKIRNTFAHGITSATFNQSPIKERCANIKLVEGFFREAASDERIGLREIPLKPKGIAMPASDLQQAMVDPRSRFLWAINTYSVVLGYWTQVPASSPPEPYL